MKNKIKIFIAAFCSIFILFSCSDFLEKEPHTLTAETFFNNANELDAFLTGVYSPIMQEHFYRVIL